MYIPEMNLEPMEFERSVCYRCSCCGEPIYDGDDYFDFRERGMGIICEVCIDEAHRYDAEPEGL